MSFNLTVTDLFCGAGGSSSGAEQVPGVRVRMAANHWDLAIETHNVNMPHVDHDTADISKVKENRYPHTDILWASPSCFPAGTTVLTKRGLLPIEDVQVGDLVLTHRGRWRPIDALVSKTADTVLVNGHGHTRLETTADHPFFARSSEPPQSLKVGGRSTYVPRQFGEPDWTPAVDLLGKHWATPVAFGEPLPIPQVGGRGIAFDADFWWVVGRWLGDGFLRLRRYDIPPLPSEPRRTTRPAGSPCIVCGGPARPDARSSNGRVSPYCGDGCKGENKRRHPRRSRGDVHIACGRHEADELEKRLSMVNLAWQRTERRTATVFTAAHIGLAEWLSANFGQRSHGKTVPAWALTMPVAAKESLLAGYLSADGFTVDSASQRTVQGCTTVSRRLAVGVRLLAISLGYKATLSVSAARVSGVIEGRTVRMRPSWRVNWTVDPSSRHDYTLLDELHRWGPVRSVTHGQDQVEVFNLSVAEDESYVVDGIVVHNCTFWSQARGEKRDFTKETGTEPTLFDLASSEDEDDEPLPNEAKERSRALMHDVPRFAEYHRYKAVIVENTLPLLTWWYFPKWIARMRALGYRHRVLTLNSAFAHQLGAPAPQLRDRVYVVFWQERYKAPNFDKWTRPYAWCPTCGDTVQAVHAPKDPKKPYGAYWQQYVFVCPKVTCRNHIVHPYTLPASSIIDWSNIGTRIGDRKKPLTPKTMARIEAGLRKFGGAITLEAAGNTFERRPGVRTWSVDEPLKTFHTSPSKGLAMSPPMLLPVEGRDGKRAVPTGAPMRTQTGRHETALLVPAGGTWNDDARLVSEPLRTRTTRENEGVFMVPLRNNNRPKSLAEPLDTFAANGNHHGLAMVMRNNSSRGDGGEMCTLADEPLRTLTTAGHQSLVVNPNPVALYAYDTGAFRSLRSPLPTQTTVDGDALIGMSVDINECYFRMLLVDPEIKPGMGFDRRFILLGTNSRVKVRMCGNAVTPPMSRDLVAAVAEAITGTEYELAA